MALDPSLTPRLRPRRNASVQQPAADASAPRHLDPAAVHVARGHDHLGVVSARPEIGQERHRSGEVGVDRDDEWRARLSRPRRSSWPKPLGSDGAAMISVRDAEPAGFALECAQKCRRVCRACQTDDDDGQLGHRGG